MSNCNLYLALVVKHEPGLLISSEADASIEVWLQCNVHFQAQVAFTSEMSLTSKLTHNTNEHMNVS